MAYDDEDDEERQEIDWDNPSLYSAYEPDPDDPDYAFYTTRDGTRVYMLADQEIEQAVRERTGGAPPPPVPPEKRLMVEGGPDPDVSDELDPDLVAAADFTVDAAARGMPPPPQSPAAPAPAASPGLLPSTTQQQTQTTASSSTSRSGQLPDEMVQRQAADIERTQRELAEAEQDAAITVAAAKSARAARMEQAGRDLETAQAAAARQAEERAKVARQKVAEVSDKPITDPWKDAGIGGQILGAIGIFLGGISGYMQGRENNALKEINNGIQRSVQLQMRNKDDQIQRWEKELGSAEAAKTAAELKAWQGVKMRLEANLVDEEAQEVLSRGQVAVEAADAKIAELTGKLEREAYGNLVASEQSQTTTSQGSSMARPAPARGAGAGVAAGAAPNVLPVGVEDESPEVRQQLAAGYNPSDTTSRGQMNLLTKEMESITKQEQTLKRLEEAYGVLPDKDGNYPEDADYATSATGIDPFDAWDEDADRAMSLTEAWTEVEALTREGWKTEPNGEVTQIRLSGVQKPKRDDQAPRKLAELRATIERRKKALQSGILPAVRAAYKLQAGAPYKGEEQLGAPPPDRVPFRQR